MAGYLVRRILMFIPVLIGLLTVSFALLHVLPGDPARLVAGQSADAKTVESVRREMGLDRPVLLQYRDYVAGVLRGDFGRSYQSRRPVLSELAEVYPKTLVLAVVAEALSSLIGIGLGVAAAFHRNRAMDRCILVLAAFSLSFPLFYLGLMLQLCLAAFLHVLPPSGYQTGLDRFVILPAVTLAIPSSGFLARITRSALTQLMQADYLRTARAKGVRERTVILRHALPNALIPIATTIGLDFARLVGGILVIEVVFAWPGVGKYAFDALAYNDVPALQGSIMAFAISIAVINLSVDLLYGLSDPRLRLDAR